MAVRALIGVEVHALRRAKPPCIAAHLVVRVGELEPPVVGVRRTIDEPARAVLEIARQAIGGVEHKDFLGSFYQTQLSGVAKEPTMTAFREYLHTKVDACAPPQLMVTHQVTVSTC